MLPNYYSKKKEFFEPQENLLNLLITEFAFVTSLPGRLVNCVLEDILLFLKENAFFSNESETRSRKLKTGWVEGEIHFTYYDTQV